MIVQCLAFYEYYLLQLFRFTHRIGPILIPETPKIRMCSRFHSVSWGNLRRRPFQEKINSRMKAHLRNVFNEKLNIKMCLPQPYMNRVVIHDQLV